MPFAELIAGRWGPHATAGITPATKQALGRDAFQLWRTVQALTGSTAPGPTASAVHTARALPTLLRHQGATRLVYDAGLGTLCTQTFKLLNDPQHHLVVDAFLLRIAAVRRVCTDHRDTAAALAAQAEQILALHPPRDYPEDAESAFETFLAVKMQEQFAVAHELLHHLEVADPPAFHRLSRHVLKQLRECVDDLAHDPALRAAHDEGNPRPTDHDRHRAGVEPDSWWHAPRFDPPPTAAPDRVEPVLAALVGQARRDTRLLTEVTCDIVAATACAVNAQRGNGWTPLQSTAASVLSLATLGLVVDMDRRPSPIATTPQHDHIDEWQLRLDGLRVLLAHTAGADTHDPDASPTPTETADAMRRAKSLYDAVIRTRYAHIDTWPATTTPAAATTTDSELLLAAGFLNLRPDPRAPHQRHQDQLRQLHQHLRPPD